MAERVKELAERLNLGNVEIGTNKANYPAKRKEQRASLMLKRVR